MESSVSIFVVTLIFLNFLTHIVFAYRYSTTSYRLLLIRNHNRLIPIDYKSTTKDRYPFKIYTSSTPDMNWDPKSAEKLDFNEDYYTLLEVDPLINQRELKKAYYKIVFKYHPDGKQTEREKLLSNKQMMVINAAYKVLKDPIAREKYDIKRRSAASSKPPSSSYTSSRATSSTASSNVYRERPSSVNSEYSNSPFSNYFQNEQEDQVTESLSDVVSELIKDVLSPDGRKGLLDEFVSFLEGVDDRRDTANDLSSSQIELVRDAAKNLKRHLGEMDDAITAVKLKTNSSNRKTYDDDLMNRLRADEELKGLEAKRRIVQGQIKELDTLLSKTKDAASGSTYTKSQDRVAYNRPQENQSSASSSPYSSASRTSTPRPELDKSRLVEEELMRLKKAMGKK